MGNKHCDQFKKQIESIPVPQKLDLIIQESIRKGKKEIKRRKFKQMILKIAASAAAVAIIFTATVNMSAAFAKTMGKLPLVSDLVEMVRFMKAGEYIINGGNVQHIGQVSEDKGITISIDPIIVDGKTLMVPFKIIVSEEYKDVQRMIFSGLSIRDKNGKEFSHPSFEYMLGASEDFANGPNGREMNLELSLVWVDTNTPRPSEFIITSNKIRAVSTKDNWDYIKGNWAFNIKLDKTSIAKPVEYIPLGEIQLGDSTYTIDSIKSYPTAAEVRIKNGKQFYQEIKDYAVFLEDEAGNRYASPRGSSVEGKAVLSFESIYYENLKEIYMVFSPKRGEQGEYKVKIGEIVH